MQNCPSRTLGEGADGKLSCRLLSADEAPRAATAAYHLWYNYIMTLTLKRGKMLRSKI